MRIKIEFAVALLVAAAAWLWLFPSLGASSAQLSPWLLAALIAAYAGATTYLFQFFYGAEILLGARVQVPFLLAKLLAAQVVPQYVVCVLLSLVVPGVVTSYAWFALAVVIAFVAQYLLLIAIGPIRSRADTREMLSKVTLRVWTYGAFLPVLKGDKLVDGERLLIPASDIKRVETLVEKAWNAGLKLRDWDASDRNLLEAIPQLKHCGALQILRLSAACCVLRQSHEALGNEREVALYTANMEYLSRVYRAATVPY